MARASLSATATLSCVQSFRRELTLGQRPQSLSQFTDWSQTRAEIEVIEVYGGNDWSGYHAAVHLWPARNPD